jgi:hypothetical protein
MINVVDSKQYFLSPRGRLTENLNGDYNSYVRYALPRLIERRPNALYNTVRLLHAELPYSFYVVNAYNNGLTFQVGGTTYTRSLAEGNYTSDSIMSALTLAFQPLSVTITLDELNGKLSFTAGSPYTISNNTLNPILGLTDSSHIAIFDGGEAYSVHAPFALNLLGTKNVFIKTNFITDNVAQTGEKNVLKSIPVLVPPYGLITYTNGEQSEALVKNPQLDYLEIELVDDDERRIDFQGQDWSITMEVRTMIQLAVSNQTISDYLATSTE